MLWSLLAKADGKVKGCALLAITGAGARQENFFPKENYLAGFIQACFLLPHPSGGAPWERDECPVCKAQGEQGAHLSF